MAATPSDEIAPNMPARVGYAKIIREVMTIPFGGKAQKLGILKTCEGDIVFQATHCAMILTNAEEAAALDHFRKVCKRCDQFQQTTEKLEDHIKVLNHITSLGPPLKQG